jgi:hypothetical protein
MSNIGAKHLDGSSGRSVIAAIAYRTASMLVEYKRDEAGNTVEVVHDFTAKRGVYMRQNLIFQSKEFLYY